MTWRVTWATAARVLKQIRRDPRTVALVIALPALLVVLLRYALNGSPEVFDRIGPPLCGLLPFVLMFLTSSITMLRERTSGTLERLMTLPLAKLDLLAGYALAFGAVAAVQALVVCAVGFGAFSLPAGHGVILVGALAVGNALLGMALGLLTSAFARTEFQAVQFLPAVVFPQLFLCGLIDRHTLAPALRAVSWAMPLTYAYDALERAAGPGSLGAGVARDIGVIAAVTVVSLGLGALTLRRKTA